MLSEGAPPACQKNPARRAWRKKWPLGGLELFDTMAGRQRALAAQGQRSRSTSPTATLSIWVSRRRSSGGIFRMRRLKHHMRKRWRIMSKRSLNEPMLTPPDLQLRENTPRYGHKWHRQCVTCRPYQAALPGNAAQWHKNVGWRRICITATVEPKTIRPAAADRIVRSPLLQRRLLIAGRAPLASLS